QKGQKKSQENKKEQGNKESQEEKRESQKEKSQKGKENQKVTTQLLSCWQITGPPPISESSRDVKS
ncbi:MAG TPA: hypothetical protein G4N99_03160, partial [Thermoflexia bacterium]|nr:hypothetical protein [Thermoflexia bacterium]